MESLTRKINRSRRYEAAVWRLGVLALLLGAVGIATGASEQVKRVRNEGTATIPASNVMGNGNISALLEAGTRYDADGFHFDPVIGGQLGIGGILQASGKTTLVGTKGFGPTEVYLQATLPGNDKLRFFGLALRGDLYLSTSQDTLSQTADTSKPEFHPYLLPSLVVDLDLLARWNYLPLKLYVYAGMADNAQLLYRYNQIAVRGGVEWKMLSHAVFLDAGCGLYQEKAHRYNSFTKDKSYEQVAAWLAPGGRYRLFGRFSLVGRLKFTYLQMLKDNNPLPVDFIGASVRLEAPIYFRETNTEAIRTLVFMENKKKKIKDQNQEVARQGEVLKIQGIDLGMGTRQDEESFDYQKEQEELVRRRKEAQDKMEEIELLLLEIEAEEEGQ